MGRRQYSERYIDLVMEDRQERTARQVLDEIMFRTALDPFPFQWADYHSCPSDSEDRNGKDRKGNC